MEAALTGSIEAVEAAAAAFQETVLDLAARPQIISPRPDLECLTSRFAKPKKTGGELPYKILESGLELSAKPDAYTHLFTNQSLVLKGTHDQVQRQARHAPSVCA